MGRRAVGHGARNRRRRRGRRRSGSGAKQQVTRVTARLASLVYQYHISNREIRSMSSHGVTVSVVHGPRFLRPRLPTRVQPLGVRDHALAHQRRRYSAPVERQLV